jgi:hypothetical protein
MKKCVWGALVSFSRPEPTALQPRKDPWRAMPNPAYDVPELSKVCVCSAERELSIGASIANLQWLFVSAV